MTNCRLLPTRPGRARVRVWHEYPPIPYRDCDWGAALDGYEPGEPLGWGPTPRAAIKALAEQRARRGDPRDGGR